MLVSGWPTPERPERGIFNSRAAEQLRDLVNLKVIFIRAWVPGRKWLTQLQTNPYPVFQACMPLIGDFKAFDVRMTRIIGRHLLHSVISRDDLLHSVSADTTGVPTSFWAKSLGIPHVSQLIGSDINIFLPAFRDHIMIRGWERNATSIICNSFGLADQAKKVYPHLKDIKVVYRGVDLEYYKQLKVPKERGCELNIMYFGGLPASVSKSGFGTDLKGGVTLMRAWGLIEKEDKCDGLRIVFAGPGSDCETARKWKKGLKFPEKVEILGALHPNDVKMRLQNGDLLVLPSRFEGLPNLALESIACGTPVLGSDIPGVREVVKQDKSGWLVPVADPYALGQSILSVVKQIREGNDQRVSSRAWACEGFDNKFWAKRVLEIYQNTIERYKSTRRRLC